jgi:hypothetical protein
VDKYAGLFGFPYQLTTEIHSFVIQTGLMDAFWDVIYSDDSQRGSCESQLLNGLEARGTWAVTTPGNDSK